MPIPNVIQTLTQGFLTNPCPLCQRSASSLPLCKSCYHQLLACQWPHSRCPQKLKQSANKSTTPRELSIFSWGRYQAVLKQTLTLLKYGNQAELGIWLGHLLGQWWQANKPTIDKQVTAVPIPLHEQRLQKRGYNQAALIAKGFCRVTRMPLYEKGLIRIRATDAMHALRANERQTNLAGAFQLGNSVPSKRQSVLLVDDIYTTGATGKAAAAKLQQAGYRVIGIATVARAVLLSQSVE